MQSTPLLDSAGRRRSPATTSSFHEGRASRNKGICYPPDPPTVEEIIAVMRVAGENLEGVRLRGIIVVLWRAGLRISEALALNETDLDPDRGSVIVRHGKGDKRREVGMDRWAWIHLAMAEAPGDVAGRATVLHRSRPDARTAMRFGRDPRPASRGSCASRRQAPVRAAPTASRTRCRDVTRGHFAAGDPAPARARRSSDHLPIPARNRQHRDHRRRPSAARTDDPRRPATDVSPLSPPSSSKLREARTRHQLGTIIRRQGGRALRAFSCAKAIARGSSLGSIPVWPLRTCRQARP
jgi:Phage integrase family